jgi:ABC-2 type transport system ATP-binding protein
LVIASGTATELKEQAGAASVELTVTHASDLAEAEALVRRCSPEVHVEPISRRITAQASGLGDVTRIAQLFEQNALAVDDLGLKRPSLDDVFLHLTGHRAESEPAVDDQESALEEELAR